MEIVELFGAKTASTCTVSVSLFSVSQRNSDLLHPQTSLHIFRNLRTLIIMAMAMASATRQMASTASRNDTSEDVVEEFETTFTPVQKLEVSSCLILFTISL